MSNMEAIKSIVADLERLHPVQVDDLIEIARDPASPLHDEFEWDDSIAAHEHRRAQARALLRRIHYAVFDETPSVVRTVSYVRDPRIPAQQQGYIAITRAAKDRQLAADVVVAELDRAIAAIVRARRVSDVLDIETGLDEVEAKIEAMKGDVLASVVPPVPRRRYGRSVTRPESRPSV